MARFEQRNAQVLGISVDSVFSHRAWANILGGIAFPLLADFHPKGEVARQYGIWREDKGFSRRAIFILDPDGVVQYSDVIPKGPPNVEVLLSEVDRIGA